MSEGPPIAEPVLTIAIPTYNRQAYLELNLKQLKREIDSVARGKVEVLVSDNCSPDDTQLVVEAAQRYGLALNYKRNAENLGWAKNFAQAFDAARGKYILMLGDDDLLVEGTLSLLLDKIEKQSYGVVCMRPYGYDEDFEKERPIAPLRAKEFNDSGEFLLATHRWFTLTSALVLNKSLLGDVDSEEFIDTDLATFHLMLRASLAADQNLFLDAFLVAGKRQNSFSYEYADVFVDQFWRILESQVRHGLRLDTLRLIEKRRLFSYYPFYMLDLRLTQRGDLQKTRQLLEARFGSKINYWLWLAPILYMPRILAIPWGAAVTSIGRIAAGDLRRGVKFMKSKFYNFSTRS